MTSAPGTGTGTGTGRGRGRGKTRGGTGGLALGGGAGGEQGAGAFVLGQEVLQLAQALGGGGGEAAGAGQHAVDVRAPAEEAAHLAVARGLFLVSGGRGAGAASVAAAPVGATCQR